MHEGNMLQYGGKIEGHSVQQPCFPSRWRQAHMKLVQMCRTLLSTLPLEFSWFWDSDCGEDHARGPEFHVDRVWIPVSLKAWCRSEELYQAAYLNSDIRGKFQSELTKIKILLQCYYWVNEQWFLVCKSFKNLAKPVCFAWVTKSPAPFHRNVCTWG